MLDFWFRLVPARDDYFSLILWYAAKKILLRRNPAFTRIGAHLIILVVIFFCTIFVTYAQVLFKNIYSLHIFYIFNFFNSCHLNCITGEIVVILIIYPQYLIFLLSFILFEHQNNDTTATAVVECLHIFAMRERWC